jgi:lipopolysaccharide export system protein LptA
MTMRRAPDSGRLLPWIAVLLIAAASGAIAQQQQQQPSGPPNALQGFSQNRNQPVKINAASLEVHDRNKIATFTGNVHLVQGDTTLRCKVLVVHYDADQAGGPTVKSTTPATPGPSGTQQISKMEAKGGVIVTQKDQTATGDSATYDMKENIVRLFAPAGGYVAVTQGPNVVRGPRLVVHLDTGVSHFEGGVESLIIPNSQKGGDTKAAPAADTKTAPRQGPKAQPAHPNGLY